MHTLLNDNTSWYSTSWQSLSSGESGHKEKEQQNTPRAGGHKETAARHNIALGLARETDSVNRRARER